ncbi:FAD-dependent oxidoreductase [Propionivibrio sp.]|uniref:FAD-dependent oxidoreductase n=1 Tax=Propionivibrio sp. TaxID=2212460 RepID=UPI0026058C76|nr:FAD-dependent oxidoreductase [Propionivibrio sp.]
MDRPHRLSFLQRQEPFDLLVIGGGATGCGIAVDAASRGLQVALIEKNDIAEGTSSRSTKLVHGGVRYLEMAIKHLDRAQYHLVREGLFERGTFLKNAPHLANRIALVTPLYRWLDVPYVFSGLLLYDFLAGKKGLGHSNLISRQETLRRLPMLKADGLRAGVVYYDGQFNDARMAVTLALTAQQHGAVVANHLAVLSLVKASGKLCGAKVCDTINGNEFTIHARGVINATGPFVDRLRQMDDAAAEPILKVSSGIHIVLAQSFAPPETGLMIPKTEDGRILFILPWQGHALIGTTENPAEITDHPQAKEEEIEYLLRHINRYFDLAVTRSDIKSVWSGLRPLVLAPKTKNTAQLVREHLVQVSASGLLTIAGGKWTSYRKMAEEAVDQAIHSYGLAPARACHTDKLLLLGAEHFNHQAEQGLIQTYGLAADVAYRLHHAYGDQAVRVAELAQSGLGSRLHLDHPYLEAEVVYATRHEFAERACDVLTRRLSLAFLDTAAAKATLPRVIELMAVELGWDQERRNEEMKASDQAGL